MVSPVPQHGEYLKSGAGVKRRADGGLLGKILKTSNTMSAVFMCGGVRMIAHASLHGKGPVGCLSTRGSHRCFVLCLGIPGPWKGWARMLAQRSRSHTHWDGIPGGRGPSAGVGGVGRERRKERKAC